MALGTSVSLFLYFWIVGYPVVVLLHSGRDLIRNILIAPATGIVVTMLSTYAFSRLGFPIGVVARPLGISTLVLAAAALIWRRPPIPLRRLAPYSLVLVLAFATAGWPLLDQGFAWLAYHNPDMTNYVFGADRLMREPFIAVPDPAAWARQSDWSAYFLIFPLSGVRSGAELLLAWVSAITGRDGPSIYMPLLVALHVAVIAAATALVSTPYRSARLFAGMFLSSAALASLGVQLQLLGQLVGLTCLTLACALCLSPFYRLKGSALARFIVFASLVMACFILAYPEMLPFFGLAFLVHHALGARDIRAFFVRGAATVAAIASITAALIAPEIGGLVTFMFAQARSAGGGMSLPELFPYFLIPSGLAALWGLRPHITGGDVLLLPDSISVAIGIVLTLAAVVSTIWLVWRREPAAALVAVMTALAPLLFFQDSGFGTFKLAMYIQPFLLPTCVLSLCLLLRVAK